MPRIELTGIGRPALVERKIPVSLLLLSEYLGSEAVTQPVRSRAKTGSQVRLRGADLMLQV
jgi:hypothetical protein